MLLLVTNFSFASFPVERVSTTPQSEVVSSSTNNDEDNTMLVSPAASGEKSQGVALLLWIFLGGFAAHRWYLGSPWYWNVLFIITLGGLLVWAIIDLVGIITGNYQPKKGSYKNSFW